VTGREPPARSAKGTLWRDFADVVEVIVADAAAQGPDDVSGVIVGPLNVHRLAFVPEGDIAATVPGAAAPFPGDQDVHQAGLTSGLCRRTDTRSVGMPGDDEPGRPAALDHLGIRHSRDNLNADAATPLFISCSP